MCVYVNVCVCESVCVLWCVVCECRAYVCNNCGTHVGPYWDPPNEVCCLCVRVCVVYVLCFCVMVCVRVCCESVCVCVCVCVFI